MIINEEFAIDEKLFRFRSSPHLQHGNDWHTAYIPIINNIIEGDDSKAPIDVPAYPLLIGTSYIDQIYEMGAYWEGSLYFMCNVIGAKSPLQGIKEIERQKSSSSMGLLSKLFLAIWNSHGQLKWLKAHYIRENSIARDLIDPGDVENPKFISKVARATKDKDLAWLAAFVDQHSEEGSKYPNPYFGGTNPLHLGLILSEFSYCE